MHKAGAKTQQKCSTGTVVLVRCPYYRIGYKKIEDMLVRKVLRRVDPEVVTAHFYDVGFHPNCLIHNELA